MGEKRRTSAKERGREEEIGAALQRHFGHDVLRPAQVPAVRAMLTGRDLLAVLPTGSGKSLCFQLPALMRPGLTLVLSPLVSLMEDQVEKLTSRGIPAAALHSSMEAGARRAAERALAAGDLKLLYVAPERLPGERFRSRLAGTTLGRLVVDEAHCISEWGHDFRPAYRAIGGFARRMGRPPVAAFTATATPRTRADIRRSLGLSRPVEVLGSVDRPNLTYRVEGRQDLVSAAARAARAVRRAAGASIVYAGTRRRTVRLAGYLRRRGVRVGAYHAGLAARERAAVQEAFLRERLPTVCATTAFGMGVDHGRVRLVCHLGLPASLEGYVQEAGRAGRDGRPARCLLLPLEGDDRLHETLQASTWPRPRSARRVWRTLRGGEPMTEATLARRLGGRVSGPERDGAVRVLALHGLLTVGQERADAGGRLLRRRSGRRLSRATISALRTGRRRARDRYRAVTGYARSRRCRRAVIADYFGEEPPPCRGCDRCEPACNKDPVSSVSTGGREA